MARGRVAFDSYFAAVFGAERWPALRRSLERPVQHVVWVSPWWRGAEGGRPIALDESGLRWLRTHVHDRLAWHPLLPGCAWVKHEALEARETVEALTMRGAGDPIRTPRFPNPAEPRWRDRNGLLPFYLLDGASVLAANTVLPDGPGTEARGKRVLDLCAAPGGKTLVLAALLWGPRDGPSLADPESGAARASRLVANELSPARRQRLQATLRAYLPAALLSRVRVEGRDATRWVVDRPTTERGAYDAVLADVPCSAERHLLQQWASRARRRQEGATATAAKGAGEDEDEDGEEEAEVEDEEQKWSEKRTGALVSRQTAILAAAVDAAKEGGRVVYATCSLNPKENAGVTTRVAERRREVALGAGRLVLPDEDPDRPWGPLFVSELRKGRR